ncbi:MAG: Hpt domain-containing protein [Gammaproteobacteria bacterium]|nr:Hpt domain-containing protein [Gammaproteobacteria bacterium]
MSLSTENNDNSRLALSFDEEAIGTLRKLMGEEQFTDFIQGVINRTEKQLADLRAALQERDAEKIHFITHSLKGSMGNIGATDMSRLAHELTYDVKNNGIQDYTAAHIEQLIEVFEKVKFYFEKEIT